MLVNSSTLKGLVIRATDGELGTVDELYFDDVTWAIRFLKVDTGGWLSGRNVLISPFSIDGVDWNHRRLDVALTKKQVENSPDIDTHMPISRQHEASYLGYYGYPAYWNGPYSWGPTYFPMAIPVSPAMLTAAQRTESVAKESLDSHLRTTAEVTGYHIEASDGEIGHVTQFVVDDETWTIRYLDVATNNWWPGKKVLVSPGWVESVSWTKSKVFVALSRKAIQNCPEYDESMLIDREYENRVYYHYGQRPYWLIEDQHRPVLAGTAV